MANKVERQILLDGYRNAIVKLTGVLDTTDVAETPAFAMLDFQNNDPYGRFVGFRVDRVEYSIGSGIEILLEWNSVGNPQQITPLAGRGKIDGWWHGGWVPDRTRAGYDGSINLKSSGFMAGKQNFAITVEMVKLYV